VRPGFTSKREPNVEYTNIVPQWMSTMLQGLHEQRDKLKAKLDVLEKEYETARRACVPVQQLLSKINDAIQSLGQAVEWAGGSREEVPF